LSRCLATVLLTICLLDMTKFVVKSILHWLENMFRWKMLTSLLSKLLHMQLCIATWNLFYR
jgi:hypothetical protein